MKKRGSHVGVILSLAIFVTFLVFLYVAIEPLIKIQKDKESLLDYLEVELTERFTADLTGVTVGIDKSVSQTCIQLEELINNAELSFKLIVKDGQLDRILESNISQDGNDLFVATPQTNVLFKIYESEEFAELNRISLSGCRNLQEGMNGYNIGLIRTNEYIFESRILDMIEEYNAGYEGLKEELRIPPGSGFGFGLTYTDRTKVKTKEKEISTSIYAEEIPIQYIDREANINFGFLNIRVW